MASTKHVVILGAGVSGLTSALLLSRIGKYDITVAAKHMPGDYDAEYASPAAGANVMPMSAKGSEASDYEKRTWLHLERLCRELPEAGIHFQESALYSRGEDSNPIDPPWFASLIKSDPWFKKMTPNFHQLQQNELPPGYVSGTGFTSMCLNIAIYLPWLFSQCLKNGVKFKRANISHISEAAKLHHSVAVAKVVINCTGIGSAKLGGVKDSSMVPARGQIVLVRNEAGPMIATSGTDHGKEELCYMMQRAAGGGTILGGSYQLGNWDPNPDPALAKRIIERAVQIYPALTGGKGPEFIDIVRHGVGLRPVRTKGIRIEKERLAGIWVVHNYGHGGYGYQTSYGCAEKVVYIVESLPKERAML